MSEEKQNEEKQNDKIEYTEEMLEEDKRICLFVYKKNFKYFERYFDDLLQSGLLFCFKARKRYEPGHDCSFFTFACEYVRGGMLTYLERNCKKHDLNTTSGDELVWDDDDNTTIFDTIEDTFVDFDSNFNYEQIKKIAYGLLNSEKYSKKSDLRKQILKRYIENDFILTSLHKELKTTKQNVSLITLKFKKDLKKILIEKGFNY